MKSLLSFLTLACTDATSPLIMRFKNQVNDRSTKNAIPNKRCDEKSIANPMLHCGNEFMRIARRNDEDSFHEGTNDEFEATKWTPLGDIIVGEAINDESGTIIAMSDDGGIIAIGAHWNNGGGTFSGHVRIYRLSPNLEWTQIGNDIYGKTSFEYFGWSLDLSSSGSRIVIGGWATNVVRIYENKSDNWEQIGSDLEGNGSFGYTVSMSSNGATLAVGAPEDDSNGVNSGSVQVYKDELGAWNPVGTRLLGNSAFDYFGNSVSISNDSLTLAIGAPGNNSPGYASVFKFEERTIGGRDWVKNGSNLNGDRSEGGFGAILSLSGDGVSLAVTGLNNGFVKVFKISGNGWVQTGKRLPVQDFAVVVSLSYDGEWMIVGDRYNDQVGDQAGRAQVFQLVNEDWKQVGDDLYSFENGETFVKGHEFGAGVAISKDGSIVAAGAPYSSFEGKANSGHVRVFDTSIEVRPTKSLPNSTSVYLTNPVLTIALKFICPLSYRLCHLYRKTVSDTLLHSI